MAKRKKRSDYPPNLGARIRLARLEKKLTMVEVAKRADLTPSSISQVENAKISPTIATLKKIAAALGRPLGDFFDASPVVGAGRETHQPASPVIHRNQRKLLSPGKGVTFQLLNPDLSGPIEFIYNIYEPGAGTGIEQYTHPGSECGLIIEGELLVTIRDQSYLLKEGDSITFDSTAPHAKQNPGAVRCVCVWANHPPWF